MSWHDLLTPNGKPAADVQPLLEFQDLSAGYNGQAAIHDVNLRFYPGEFAALVGDNGAGKSTLALAAAGLIRPMKRTGAFQHMVHGRAQDGILHCSSKTLPTSCSRIRSTRKLPSDLANYRCFDPA